MIGNASWQMLAASLATAALAVLVGPGLRRLDAEQLRRTRAHGGRASAHREDASSATAGKTTGVAAEAGDGSEPQPLRH